MDSPHSDFQLVANGYECVHYEETDFGQTMTLKSVRQRSDAECPACRLRLACVDWAVPKLFAYNDIRYLVSSGLSLGVTLQPWDTFELTAFQLDGTSWRPSVHL
jgi:hypothetical protein